MQKYLYKRLLLFIWILTSGSTLFAQTISSMQAGVTFRFDDYQDPIKLEKIRTVFNKHGKKFVYALNAQIGDLREDPNYWPTVKKLANDGHELLDQSPNDLTQFFQFMPNENTSVYLNKPGVDHINEKERKVCLKYTLKNTNGLGNEGKVKIKDNMLISVNNGEWDSDKLWGSNYFSHIYLPSKNQLLGIAYFYNNNPNDPDTAMIRSFWIEEMNFADEANLDYRKINPYEIEIHENGIQLLAQKSLEIFAKYELPKPQVFIHPGGQTPYIPSTVIEKIYGKQFGYTCGNSYPQLLNTYLMPNPNGTNRFRISGGDFTEEYYSVDQIKKIISDNIARHFTSISINHLSDWGGASPIDSIVKKLDIILAWCNTNNIPVRTFSEVYEDMYEDKFDPERNIFPSFGTDLNQDGIPDGITLTVARLEPNGGVSPSFPIAYSSNETKPMLNIQTLGGISKGWNVLSMYTKGGQSEWDNIGLYLQMPEIGVDVLESIKAQTTEYALKTVRFFVPDNVTYMSIFLNGNSVTGARVYMCGVQLRAENRPVIDAKILSRNANTTFKKLNLNEQVFDKNFNDSQITWQIINQPNQLSANLLPGNFLELKPIDKFWTGKDQIKLVAMNPSSQSDTAIFPIESYLPSACANCEFEMSFDAGNEDSVYKWTSNPNDISLTNKTSNREKVYPVSNTNYTLSITSKGNQSNNYNLSVTVKPSIVSTGSDYRIYLKNKERISVPLSAFGLNSYYSKAFIKTNSKLHEINLIGDEDKTDSLVLINNTSYSGFDEVNMSFVSPTCDVINKKLIISSFANSLQENPIFESIEVYPNPSQNEIRFINLEEGSYVFEMYDLVGNKLLETRINTGDSVETLNLASGIYIGRISKDNRSRSFKIIKE
ncbi:MAG: T9SS type A sorting domain-containing protein [Bacteroidia bacterium]